MVLPFRGERAASSLKLIGFGVLECFSRREQRRRVYSVTDTFPDDDVYSSCGGPPVGCLRE